MSSADKEALDRMAGDWARDHDELLARAEKAEATLGEWKTGHGAMKRRAEAAEQALHAAREALTTIDLQDDTERVREALRVIDRALEGRDSA